MTLWLRDCVTDPSSITTRWQRCSSQPTTIRGKDISSNHDNAVRRHNNCSQSTRTSLNLDKARPSASSASREASGKSHFVQSANSSPPTLSRVQTPHHPLYPQCMQTPHHPLCLECRLLTTHVVQSADTSPPTLFRVQTPHHPLCLECRLLITHFV